MPKTRGFADLDGRLPVAIFAATDGEVQRIQVKLATALAERGIAIDCVLRQARST